MCDISHNECEGIKVQCLISFQMALTFKDQMLSVLDAGGNWTTWRKTCRNKCGLETKCYVQDWDWGFEPGLFGAQGQGRRAIPPGSPTLYMDEQMSVWV